jgi:Fic family protein
LKTKNEYNCVVLLSKMRITERKYLEAYNKLIGNVIPNLLKEFDFSESNGGFEYLTKSSAVYSSNIEGNSIDLNSYMNYELNKDKFKVGKEIEEIEDLIEAYEFAQSNKLTEKNLLNCHSIFSDTLLIRSKRGKYRSEQVGVFGKSGLAYMAVEPEMVDKEMKLFFQDLNELITTDLNEIEVFYFASLIHLRFAHIHPFRDGNGRAARLIEKWFVSEKLGRDFWKIPSEEYYKINQARYYETINLGVNFYELNYDRCIGFLEMLPNCLT